MISVDRMLRVGAAGGVIAGLGACSGQPAVSNSLAYVGQEKTPHEATTWLFPVKPYAPDGTDIRVGRVGPGELCEQKRIVNRPQYNEIITESGEPMDYSVYTRTLFSECIQPGKDTQ